MICLNMIVKNEAQDIERCLESVKPYIDYWLISDTGSTDNTVEIMEKCLEGIPGKILHHKWKNFGHNRELILQEAYKNPDIDYVFIIDAGDEALIIEDKSVFDNLTADCYYIEKYSANSMLRYDFPALLNIKNTEWHWKGVVHNYLDGTPKTNETLKGCYIQEYEGTGGKSDGVSNNGRFLRDIGILEKELEKGEDARYRFYLAQSYMGLKDYQNAYDNYVKVIQLNKYPQEIYWSMLCTAFIKGLWEDKFQLGMYLSAYSYRPTRQEALYEMAVYCNKSKLYPAAYLFARTGYELPKTKDIVFVRKDVEDWKMAEILSAAAFNIGRYRECKALCDELLTGDLPQEHIRAVWENRTRAVEKMGADYYDERYKVEKDFSRYDEIYKKAGEWATGKVLDIGCGTGELSKYIEDYHGFDFSKEAIGNHNTWVGDAYTENLEGYDTYVLLEVLEHLDDLRVLSRIPKGKDVIFSVPSFNDVAHMRTYTEETVKRLPVKIKEIVRFNWHDKWAEGNDTADYILLVRGENAN